MTAAIATLQLTPSQLMAFRDLVLDYVVSGKVSEFNDVVAQVITTPEQLLALLTSIEPVLPATRPPNTLTAIELDAHLEREQAAARERLVFEQSGGVEGADLPPLPPAHLDLSPGCHRGAAMEARYQDGVLTFTCVLCRSKVINVLVGS